MLSAVPQRPASLSPSYGSRDESRKKKCVQDHSYFEPKTSSKHSLKEAAMSPTCFTSSKPETFDWLSKFENQTVLVKVYGEHKEERPEQNTHRINVSCHHHYSKCYDFLYSCLKNKQNLPAKLVWTTLQKSVLEKEYGFTVSTKCQMDFNSEAIKWCHKIAQLFSS